MDGCNLGEWRKYGNINIFDFLHFLYPNHVQRGDCWKPTSSSTKRQTHWNICWALWHAAAHPSGLVWINSLITRLLRDTCLGLAVVYYRLCFCNLTPTVATLYLTSLLWPKQIKGRHLFTKVFIEFELFVFSNSSAWNSSNSSRIWQIYAKQINAVGLHLLPIHPDLMETQTAYITKIRQKHEYWI